MEIRDRILRETKRLTLELGVVPSLNTVAAAAEVSKGGLMHHFPTRVALLDGLAMEALTEIDQAMRDAAAAGNAVETWLAVSVPEGEDIALFRSMAVAHRALGEHGLTVMDAAIEATKRWEGYLAAELSDPALAHVIRLVGDGLMLNAATGLEVPTRADTESLTASFRRWAAGSTGPA
ncbi:TetR/AcrR family transcriptional regulator [Microbacterium sp. DT81.1]|uniref:TetR/AcrR family transcriptional regulator n=1 Tax=Microbacterium sp. DT81.1 TaxID=3393413 RepID=UPI003CF3A671